MELVAGKLVWQRNRLQITASYSERHSEPPSLAALARVCQLNEFSLRRGFRQLFGTSVGGFVQAQRLKEAHHRLLGGCHTVAAIAYQLGYAHPPHFHRAFKKHVSYTPK